MLHRSMLIFGLATAVLSVSPAHNTMVGTDDGQKEEAQVTSSRGIETQRVEGGVLKTDVTGKGAVLCIWGIYEALRAVGQECHKNQDGSFQKELNRSLDQIDRFIIKNGHTKRANLETRRVKGLEELHASGDICLGDARKMYDQIRSRGAAALHASTVDLLSIPREPVMAPCL